MHIVNYLQASGLVSIRNIDDYLIVYDNLMINNEIISNENIEDYKHFLEKLPLNFKENILEAIKQGQHILLNFYDESGRFHDCLMPFYF